MTGAGFWLVGWFGASGEECDGPGVANAMASRGVWLEPNLGWYSVVAATKHTATRQGSCLAVCFVV